MPLSQEERYILEEAFLTRKRRKFQNLTANGPRLSFPHRRNNLSERHQETLAVPGIRRRCAGWQHIRGRVENRPLPFMFRTVNDQVLLGLVCALAPGVSTEDAEGRADQVPVVWIPDDGDQDSETMSIKITS
jgi:hypothetical protein